MTRFAGPMIPKKLIKPGKSLRQVGVTFAINDVEPFAGVRMVEAQTISLGRLRKIGSEQESVKVLILRGFLGPLHFGSQHP